MSDNDLIRRGDVKAFSRSFVWRDYSMSGVTVEDIDSVPAVPQEMTAREYAKILRRIRNEVPSCSVCPVNSLVREPNETCLLCDLQAEFESAFSEAMHSSVEQWAADHPEKKRKTYAEDFREKFPNSLPDIVGAPLICRDEVYHGRSEADCGTTYSCTACWNEEMEVQDG